MYACKSGLISISKRNCYQRTSPHDHTQQEASTGACAFSRPLLVIINNNKLTATGATRTSRFYGTHTDEPHQTQHTQTWQKMSICITHDTP